MSTKTHLLTYLVADLIRAEIGQPIPDISNLREKFKNDPESVMNDYGLTETEKVVLYTMDRQLICQFMAREILATPSTGDTIRWSDPRPHIALNGTPKLQQAPDQELTLSAACVLSSAVIHLASVNAYNHLVAVPTIEPNPHPLEDLVLRATFDLSQAALGVYDVLLYNTPDSSPLRADQQVTVVESNR